MYVAKSLNCAIIAVLCCMRQPAASAVFPTSLKDVEKTHVREDSLLRGRGRPEGRERNIWRNAAKLQRSKFNLTLYWDLTDHDACPHLSLE